MSGRSGSSDETVQLEFADNSLLPLLFGERDAHLLLIERLTGATLVPRGNLLAITGTSPAVGQARTALRSLQTMARAGQEIGQSEIEAAIRLSTGDDASADQQTLVKTRKRQIKARTQAQAEYIRALKRDEMVFGLGPAGTGKTYLAVATAVDMLMTGTVKRIILSRPAVEAGERLGFLPGDLKEKVDPYLRPLYDALADMLPQEQVTKRLGSGEIEVAPLAFMRGRTLANAFIILDEAQNTTAVQMKMFLTRLGEGSRMAVTGDLSQIDLPSGVRSGLSDAIDVIEGTEGVGVVRFTESDVVRHPLVSRIVQAYARRDQARLERQPSGER